MPSRPATSANLAADAAARQLDGGSMLLLDPTGQVLARLAFGNPAFYPARDGRAELASSLSALADATGTPATFEAVSQAGEIVLIGKVGTDLIINRPMIEMGATVTVDSFSYSESMK